MAPEEAVDECNTHRRRLPLYQVLEYILILLTRLILWNGIYGNAANSRPISGKTVRVPS